MLDPARHRPRRGFGCPRRELPFLAVFGICGLAFVQWFYFLAIHRLAIGIALLIQYLAPLLVALWARYVFHEQVRRRIWLALALALVRARADRRRAPRRHALDRRDPVRGRSGGRPTRSTSCSPSTRVGARDAVSLLAWGFGFAAALLGGDRAVVELPGRASVSSSVSLLGQPRRPRSCPVWALMAWMIVLGTIVPFFLLVSALRHLPATRVGIIAMLEPVVATIVAWAWLDESLGRIQLAGALVVLAAIVIAQTAR